MVNYVDIAIVAFTLILVFAGYQRGIFVSLLGLLRYLIGLPLCFLISEKYTSVAYNTFVKPRALELLTEKLSDATGKAEILNAIDDMVKALPDFASSLVELPKFNINQDNLAEQVLSNAFEPALLFLTKGALFLIVFLVFFGLTGIALSAFNTARKRKEERHGKSVLSKTDRFIGALFGICKSFVTIVALGAVIMYIQEAGLLSEGSFAQHIEASRLLQIINEINPIKYLEEVKI